MNRKLIFVLTLTLMSMGMTSAQTDTIRSIKLDSLIWKKVSEYRKTTGQRNATFLKTCRNILTRPE
ncbi:MAG: hypothetical protein LW688_08835 [Cryomorphaceae bacterium]|nr:hypothetical protein [Cryomorphaceae bacterium]